MKGQPEGMEGDPAEVRRARLGIRSAPTKRQLNQRRRPEHIGQGMPDSRTMRSITIRHADGPIDRLVKLAQARGTSLACVMREAIDVYLERKG